MLIGALQVPPDPSFGDFKLLSFVDTSNPSYDYWYSKFAAFPCALQR
jgi:hypothetical protein